MGPLINHIELYSMLFCYRDWCFECAPVAEVAINCLHAILTYSEIHNSIGHHQLFYLSSHLWPSLKLTVFVAKAGQCLESWRIQRWLTWISLLRLRHFPKPTHRKLIISPWKRTWIRFIVVKMGINNVWFSKGDAVHYKNKSFIKVLCMFF